MAGSDEQIATPAWTRRGKLGVGGFVTNGMDRASKDDSGKRIRRKG